MNECTRFVFNSSAWALDSRMKHFIAFIFTFFIGVLNSLMSAIRHRAIAVHGNSQAKTIKENSRPPDFDKMSDDQVFASRVSILVCCPLVGS